MPYVARCIVLQWSFGSHDNSFCEAEMPQPQQRCRGHSYSPALQVFPVPILDVFAVHILWVAICCMALCAHTMALTATALICPYCLCPVHPAALHPPRSWEPTWSRFGQWEAVVLHGSTLAQIFSTGKWALDASMAESQLTRCAGTSVACHRLRLDFVSTLPTC